MTASYTIWDEEKTDDCADALAWFRNDDLFPAILYEDLLIGEQVDVQTTVHEGLLRGEQADVYSLRSSMSCCGTNSLKDPALQQLPACRLDVFEYQALQQLLKEEESNTEHEEGGKGGKEEDNREISCPCINEEFFLPCAYKFYVLIIMISSDVLHFFFNFFFYKNKVYKNV